MAKEKIDLTKLTKTELCNSCPYTMKLKMPYKGTKAAEILFVGEIPTIDSGRVEKVYDKLLEFIGLDKDLTFFTTGTRCKVDKDNESAKVINSACDHCRVLLSRAINVVKPKIIVAMGAQALRQVLKKQKIMQNTGTLVWSDEFNCSVFTTVHPSYILRSATQVFPEKSYNKMTMKEKMLFKDFRLLKKIIENDFKKPEIDTTNYIEVTDFKDFIGSRVVSIDFETTGLNIRDNKTRILSVSMSKEIGKSSVHIFNGDDDDGNLILPEGLREVLEDPETNKIVAARPFEETILKLRCNITMKGTIHDVLPMAHLNDENYHAYSLEAISNIFTQLNNIKDLAEGQRTNLAGASKETIINYNGVDTDAALRCALALKTELNKDKKLLRYYVKFMLPALDMFTDCSFNGIKLDTNKLTKNEAKAVDRIYEIEQEAFALLPQSIKDRHQGDELRLSRNIITMEYLFTHPNGMCCKPNPEYLTPKTKAPQITENHLKLFNHIPYVQKVLQYKKLNKIYTSYLSPLWDHVQSDDYIYPSTMLTRTVTGRTVIAAPAMQTIPRSGEFANLVKELFSCEHGWLIGSRDLSQSEIRIIGWLAQDVNILKAIEMGVDIHTMTAASINKISINKVTPDMRQAAKAFNFGFIYGMAAVTKKGGGFKKYAKDEYGMVYTDEECIEFREAFFAEPQGYYGLPKYHNFQKFTVRRDGEVRSPLGRIRRLPDGQSKNWVERGKAERQAINGPTQSLSSDLAVIGMFLFNQEIKKRGLTDKIKPMLFVHDEIKFRAKEKYFDTAMSMLKHCLEVKAKEYIRENFGFDVGYKVESEGKVGKNFAEMEKYDDEGLITRKLILNKEEV